MSNRQPPTVLVGCDGSDAAERAAQWAVDYARATGATVRLASAWDWPTFQDVPIVYGEFDPAETANRHMHAVARRVGLSAADTDFVVDKGSPPHVLLELAKDADLLVLGSRGLGGFTRLMLGSVTTACIHHSPCPVAVIRPVEPRVRDGVLVGVDGSPESVEALRWAMRYVAATSTSLTVLRVADHAAVAPTAARTATSGADPVPSDMELSLDELVAEVQTMSPEPLAQEPQVIVAEGSPAGVMVERSADYGLTVVGHRGTGGFRRMLLGSVSTALTRHGSGCTVVVRDAGSGDDDERP